MNHRSPLMIRIIFHYTLDPDDKTDYAEDTDHGESEAVREIIADLVTRDILRARALRVPLGMATRPFYEANFAACLPYLDALCLVPLPVLTWIVPKEDPDEIA